MDNTKHPMWGHINASLEDKVNILIENPYRYYIGQNVWALKNSRQEILDDYFQTALAIEKYELCQKIQEVKTFLNFINEQPAKRDSIFLLETEESIYEVGISYHLKIENDLLKLNYKIEDSEDWNYTGQSIPVSDALGKRDILKLLKHLFDGQRLFDGIGKFRRSGLLDAHDYNSIIKEIKGAVQQNS
jgi:hypothetical protein